MHTAEQDNEDKSQTEEQEGDDANFLVEDMYVIFDDDDDDDDVMLQDNIPSEDDETVLELNIDPDMIDDIVFEYKAVAAWWWQGSGVAREMAERSGQTRQHVGQVARKVLV